ncbi:hypothetical protein DBR32_14795 [Taibaiella sp. KBW10]|uniref:hypothetical protein n=1 Tax=Taibaiella sp. KBW10 TaxID=2153357 RepID=UPI000F5970D5|nr:hypothetical protein [Taibaiella sp. KBW10]RQO29847.1 hypothetical protein DBR32_14795 [Taibaiella sp. KBW10]
MDKRSIFILLVLMMASVIGYPQGSHNRSLSINAGIWRGYNTVINKPVNFTVKGMGMGGFGASYEQKFGKLTYGITTDFADINYVTQSKKDGSFDTGNTVGIGMGREELAASNIVVTLGISTKYNLLKYKFYNLNISANPRLGLLIYNKFYDDIDGNLNNGSRDIGKSFYLYNSAKQNKWPVPLIKFTLENEFRLSKSSALLLSVGYQKGFIPVFTTDRTYMSKYNTPNETRENIVIKTKATNLSFLFGYRIFF